MDCWVCSVFLCGFGRADLIGESKNGVNVVGSMGWAWDELKDL